MAYTFSVLKKVWLTLLTFYLCFAVSVGIAQAHSGQQRIPPTGTGDGEANSESHFHIVQPGESLWGIASRYRVTVQDLVSANLLHGPTSLFVGDQLYIPYRPSMGRSQPLPFVELVDLSDPTRPQPQDPHKEWLIWPVSSAPISQLYHAAHHGIDLSTPIATSITAAGSGEVIRTDFDHPIYGQVIVIDHGDEIITIYAHLSYISVMEGYIVLQGEEIGLSGNTGRSTRPHLHFELRQAGQFLNPCNFLIEGCRK